MNPTKPTDYWFERLGFSAFSGAPNIRQRHRHDEVEMAVFGKHSILVLYGGRTMTVEPDCLVVLWGAMAHQTLRVTRGTIGQGIRIPLTWVLQWNLPKAFLHRLLSFEVFYDQPRSLPCSDTTLVRHWIDLMKEPIHSEALIPTRSKVSEQKRLSEESEQALESHRIVILEAEARLRRLAMSIGGTKGTPSPSSPAVLSCGLGHIEPMFEYVALHYHMPLRITEIAKAAGLSRNHAMRLFRRLTGMSLLKYITQHRVSHAQRLLVTTDMKITDIAYEAGFSSPTRCYAAFERYAGESPASYRKAVTWD